MEAQAAAHVKDHVCNRIDLANAASMQCYTIPLILFATFMRYSTCLLASIENVNFDYVFSIGIVGPTT